MISLMLALAAPAPLTSPEALQAMQCAAAVAVVGPSESEDEKMWLSSQVAFHMMWAARSDRAGESLLQRVQDLQSMVAQYRPEPSAAPAIAADCRSRFPQSVSTVPPKLPSDPFRRDVLCLMELSLAVGMAQSVEQDLGASTYLDRYKVVIGRFGTRVTDATLKSRDIVDEAGFMALASDELEASLASGNIISTTTSCEAIANQF